MRKITDIDGVRCITEVPDPPVTVLCNPETEVQWTGGYTPNEYACLWVIAFIATLACLFIMVVAVLAMSAQPDIGDKMPFAILLLVGIALLHVCVKGMYCLKYL